MVSPMTRAPAYHQESRLATPEFTPRTSLIKGQLATPGSPGKSITLPSVFVHGCVCACLKLLRIV